MAYIFSPERQEAALLEQDIAYANLDLARLRYLRGTDEQLIAPKKYRSIPGVLRSLRPEIVELYTDAAREALARGTAGQYAAERAALEDAGTGEMV